MSARKIKTDGICGQSVRGLQYAWMKSEMHTKCWIKFSMKKSLGKNRYRWIFLEIGCDRINCFGIGHTGGFCNMIDIMFLKRKNFYFTQVTMNISSRSCTMP
jgi:hypothetical protein